MPISVLSWSSWPGTLVTMAKSEAKLKKNTISVDEPLNLPLETYTMLPKGVLLSFNNFL